MLIYQFLHQNKKIECESIYYQRLFLNSSEPVPIWIEPVAKSLVEIKRLVLGAVNVAPMYPVAVRIPVPLLKVSVGVPVELALTVKSELAELPVAPLRLKTPALTVVAPL